MKGLWAKLKPYWDVTKNKWSVYLGALVVFLPELQTKIPEFITYLPASTLKVWIAGTGMRILGILIVVLRVRRDYLALLQSTKSSATVHS